MKAVSESTWSFQMIIFFMLIFACFLTLILSYNKAYIIKNRALTIIEKYEGVTKESIEIINGFMYEKGYNTTGKCAAGWYGAINLDGDAEKSDGTKKYYYCFKEYNKKNNANNQNNQKGLIYYQIQVFYKFNLPIIGNIAIYKISGETKSFIGADEERRIYQD